MRKLLLLRHAKSDWADSGLHDRDRPLAPRGVEAAARMAKHLAAARIRPALALVSSALRTRSTWDLLESTLEGVPVSIEDEIYEASKGDLLRRLRRLDDHVGSVLMIGHNPGMGRLAECLVGHNGAPEALALLAEKFPTGALAEITLKIGHWRELEAGCGALDSFVRPKDLD